MLDCLRSILQPVLSVRWKTSICQRCVYQRTFSIALSAGVDRQRRQQQPFDRVIAAGLCPFGRRDRADRHRPLLAFAIHRFRYAYFAIASSMCAVRDFLLRCAGRRRISPTIGSSSTDSTGSPQIALRCEDAPFLHRTAKTCALPSSAVSNSSKMSASDRRR
ncbi:MAG: hypothetical protein IPH13_18610 [Planctomycetes bacterium]|nr:hypothetical protein [Planctomycetota bacterium]